MYCTVKTKTISHVVTAAIFKLHLNPFPKGLQYTVEKKDSLIASDWQGWGVGGGAGLGGGGG